MMEQLQPILNALLAKYGWGPAVISWLSGLTLLSRIVVKPFNVRLQTALTTALANAKQDPEDAQWWHDKVLTRPWYRLGAFAMDALTSVKLPSHADFHRLTNLAETPKT